MRHWWESHFGLLWKHFFERVLLPLTGLQKCNQQSYVLARRVVVLWSMRSNSSSILQFPKQKSWKEGVKLKKKIFRLVDFDASFLLKKLSPWTNFPSCFLHWTNFPIHNSTRRSVRGLLDPGEHRCQGIALSKLASLTQQIGPSCSTNRPAAYRWTI